MIRTNQTQLILEGNTYILVGWRKWRSRRCWDICGRGWWNTRNHWGGGGWGSKVWDSLKWRLLYEGLGHKWWILRRCAWWYKRSRWGCLSTWDGWGWYLRLRCIWWLRLSLLCRLWTRLSLCLQSQLGNDHSPKSAFICSSRVRFYQHSAIRQLHCCSLHN